MATHTGHPLDPPQTPKRKVPANEKDEQEKTKGRMLAANRDLLNKHSNAKRAEKSQR
jgi:hypothetical protein